jgi:hypothetical protein
MINANGPMPKRWASPDAAGLLQDQAGYCHAGKTKDDREHDVVIASSAIK